MGQLVLGSIGSAVGQYLLPNGLSALGLQVSGQAIGGFIGASLGGALDQSLSGHQRIEGPRLDALSVQTSVESAPIPLVFGRSRIAGQVIWASRFSEHRNSRGGGKGGPRVTDFSYSVSFAVGLCEGEIDGIGRIWANGELLDQSDLDFRLYKGASDQPTDPLIAAIEGVENSCAYRGLAYVVFEDLPLDTFGQRIPNLSFEVFRSPGNDATQLEKRVRGVDLIPASGEFAYATSPVLRDDGPGRQSWINLNNARGKPDFMAAIDDLEAQLPACRSVLIVSAWFGSDLRCGNCDIRPGVETREKITRPYSWSVAGEGRETAYLVTQIEGRPVYGGTPTDASLIEAIRELKARGFSVSLYPFILMDIGSGNGLPDPHGGEEQAAFPWRGRITCASEDDQSAAARAHVDGFFGSAVAADFSVQGESVGYSGPTEWRFRRFVLHHAAIAQAAGGVDGFLIGSEMRGLTTIRDEADRFPAVDHLILLADEARALLGPQTRLSYAADWSEYFGYHPADGSDDVFFHLDSLWSHSAIDAVAIDWYAPLSDWRDGDTHLDTAIAETIHDPDYLSANIEGGEGFDWYYASEANRDTQTRTPIVDGAAAKPWVFRYKDVRNWWANSHYDRKAGTEVSTPTSWVPESKPIWITELGCPAIDKGANQPNVFVDPKSAESEAPRYSGGQRDDLIQRRYLEAVLAYWSEDAGNNPVSSVYGGPMITPDLIHVWTWDARPFPDFPVRDDIWADGANWRQGHWLNGRAGLAPLSLVVDELAEKCGLGAYTGSVDGLVSGFVIDQPMAGRDALAPLMAAYGFDLVDRSGGPEIISYGLSPVVAFDQSELNSIQTGSTIALSLADASGQLRDVRLRYQLDTPDYRISSVYARNDTVDLDGVLDLHLPLLADEQTAEGWAQTHLENVERAAAQWSFSLPPSQIALEAGDIVTLDNRRLQLNAVAGLSQKQVEAAPERVRDSGRRGSVPASVSDPVQPANQPVLHLMDLPPLPGEGETRTGFLAAAFSDSWPGVVQIWSRDGGPWRERLRLSSPSICGRIIQADGELPEGRWNEAGRVIVEIYDGELASETAAEVLAGRNRLAIGGPDDWFTVQFRGAELVEPQCYEISGLLAVDGADFTGLSPAAPCVLLDDAAAGLVMASYERDQPIDFLALPVGVFPDDALHDFAPATYRALDQQPRPPCHLKARRTIDGYQLTWIRRARLGWDNWASPDIALDEADERYLIEFQREGSVFRAMEAAVPVLNIAFSDLESWFGEQPTDFDIVIRQLSTTFGPGRAATLTIAS
jgi:hypothetical protein